MIGYYVHHQGVGHAHRAAAIAAHLREPVAALSSLQRPSFWAGSWHRLPRDDDAPTAADPTAGGQLHWVPLGDHGLSRRMAVVAAWLHRHRPRVMVVDVSVEITVLARLMGVPVVAMALPGDRTDDAHQLGFRLADAILAPWPRLGSAMCRGLDDHRTKLHHLGGLSRFDRRARVASPARHQVLALDGAGGSSDWRCPRRSGRWNWTARGVGRWADDIWTQLCAADVVVAHAGLGAISDIAAAGRPAIVMPHTRPHDEQHSTAVALRAAGLAVVPRAEPEHSAWPDLLERASRLDTHRWREWSDGTAAARAAAVISDTARSS